MSNLLDHTRSNRAFVDVKTALREIGCDVCNVKDLNDVADAILNNCVCGPNAVINATLESGNGIKILPIDRKGYKISANDEALLSGDLNHDLPKGTSVHKALWYILNRALPKAFKQASMAPAIVSIDLIKAGYDGIDYYNNKAFGRIGEGQKNGLYPGEWYLKVTTFATKEPIYTPLGAFMADFKKDIMKDVRRMIGAVVREEIAKHHDIDHEGCTAEHPADPHKPHHHHDHCCDDEPWCWGIDQDDLDWMSHDYHHHHHCHDTDTTTPTAPTAPTTPTTPTTHPYCPICYPDTDATDKDDKDDEIASDWHHCHHHAGPHHHHHHHRPQPSTPDPGMGDVDDEVAPGWGDGDDYYGCGYDDSDCDCGYGASETTGGSGVVDDKDSLIKDGWLVDNGDTGTTEDSGVVDNENSLIENGWLKKP